MKAAFLKLTLLTLIFSILISCSKDDEYKLSDLDNKIIEYIEINYPGAEIVDAKKERELIKVDIFQMEKERLVIFSAIDYEWVYSEWEVKIEELPQAVVTAVASSTYALYPIDDIDFVQIPILEYYYIELDAGDEPVYMYITPTGEIL